MRELASLALTDHYDAVLAESGGHEIRRRLEEIEDRLWYGRVDEPACLARELERAREAGGIARSRGKSLSPDILILILGYSADPLLLAVAHHAPAEVVLLREKSLSADYMQRLGGLWDYYRAILRIPRFADVMPQPVGDSAPELYRVVERLVNEHHGRRVVLDFTGAKKTMVAGAFLAAGMLDLETTYVDFENYDPTLRRPRPGRSRVERVVHPVALFRLREQQQLEQAFDGRRYEEAARLAARLEETARSPEVEDVLGRKEAESRAAEYLFLGDLARAYDDWRQGFYQDSAAGLRKLEQVPAPPQVELLARVWPGKEAEHQEIVRSLKAEAVCREPGAALAYFLDVLAWVDAGAVAARPRDSYLRLYGSVESIVYWALEVLVGQELDALQVEDLTGGGSPKRAEELRLVALGALRESTNGALKVLGSPNGRRIEAPAVHCRLAEPPLAGEAERFWKEGVESFGKLRNKAVHWLAPVPAARAADLLDFYRRALEVTIPIAAGRIARRAEKAGAPEGSERAQSAAEWADLVLAAAAGEVPSSCRPLSFTEAREVARATAASSAGHRA